ncbi:glycogen debranching protein GlgX [Dongshaea marina]|uniref:glycogen debranching protein GlgX n=1 Tax=Dongshaea marina TaxID=2047966 RepID=UPI000D3EB285|nr:glycogen debranching protein GlgX [Dongshaea marina]
MIVEQAGFKVHPGREYPLGAHLSAHGCNFVLWAPEATKVELCLFDQAEKELARIPLAGRKEHNWYCFVEGIKAGQLYGYRIHGPKDQSRGKLFDPSKLLIDPYARAINRPLEWDYPQYVADSTYMIPRSVVCSNQFDWQDVEKPQLADEDMLIYQLHVRGFTKLHPDVPPEHRGKFSGLSQPVVIDYLKQLGVTAVQLMPCTSFMTEPRLQDLGLVNFWGYNPVCFMAPEPRYANQDPVTEFKTMVRELHRAGIEVILDVVFNHTAEGGHGGPLLSFKGVDNSSYYLFDSGQSGANYSSYTNFSGCGNTFNVDHPNGLRLVMDSLRYWVVEMGVDGFRFDLAVALAREGYEFDSCSAFFKAIMQDPILSRAKMIAEPWDIGPFGYRLGQFPGHWREVNDRFRDTCRSFWRGDAGQMADFATRILGSRDLFPKSRRPGYAGVNFICYHDGVTLEDLVSYNQRHNIANAEENRDGHGNNLSSNNGFEGPSMDPRIVSIRQQQKRNLLATLLLSQGTPHFLAGDEMGRTQMGNNNAYCQDNRISWVNWEIRDEDRKLQQFVKMLIKLRQSSKVFTRLNLDDDPFVANSDEHHQVAWFHPDGEALAGPADWNTPVAQAFALDIGVALEGAERWYIMFNSSRYDIQYHLPPAGKGLIWCQVFDTAEDDGLGLIHRDYPNRIAVGRAHSLKLLKRVVDTRPERGEPKKSSKQKEQVQDVIAPETATKR